MSTSKLKKPRWFASLSKDQLRAVSSSGGRRAHALGSAHRFTSKEARAAALRRHAQQADQNIKSSSN